MIDKKNNARLIPLVLEQRLNIKKWYSELSDTRRFVLACGIGSYVAAIGDYLSVPRTHSGRWAWLLNWAIDVFGTYGTVYLWLALGTFMIAKALGWKQADY